MARIGDLEQRVQDLETLCAEVYVAGIELGLPEALITRLWSIAAEGNLPVAFKLDAPPETPRLTTARNPVAAGLPIPDLEKMDRRITESIKRPASLKLAAHFKAMPHKIALVVDDDPLMVEVLVRILRHENFELITAMSGKEALEKSAGQAVDLLVTDFHMPNMKGPELADRLRHRLAKLKVLYQTGFSDQLFEERLALAEGEAFLEKPFSAVGLREAARLVLYGRINP
ncbi:MAG: response regulator [Vicinamibacterales bacterium]